MSEINYINIKEFREKGFLQEANRLFFHPLGLALSIQIDDDGNESLGGVWDYRDDPEGMLYSNELTESETAKQKADYINSILIEKAHHRLGNYGFVIQPLRRNRNERN